MHAADKRHVVRISCLCRWGETNVKCSRLHLRAVELMEEADLYLPDNMHHRYALRVTIFMSMEVALEEHRTRANDRNVRGPRGGRPVLRRKYRQRTMQDPPSTVFDTTTDYLARYSAQASTSTRMTTLWRPTHVN